MRGARPCFTSSGLESELQATHRELLSIKMALVAATRDLGKYWLEIVELPQSGQ